MATLDNFHTGNGGAWRHHLHASEHQYNQAIGLGLQSPDRWDLSKHVPIPLPFLENDRHRRQQPQAPIVETRDTEVRDLYVQLAAQHTNVLQGDNVNSKLLYDAGVRRNQCPFRKFFFGHNRKREAPVATVCSLRHRPY